MFAITRREFCKTAAAVGLISSGGLKLKANPLGFPIGCQTWPVREMVAQDFPGTLKQLADAEQKHDFYSHLYKQYTIDLLRMAIYVRTLINNTRVREYLQARHPSVVAQFEAIIAEAKG